MCQEGLLNISRTTFSCKLSCRQLYSVDFFFQCEMKRKITNYRNKHTEFQLVLNMHLILLLTCLTRLMGDFARRGFSSSENCLRKGSPFHKHQELFLYWLLKLTQRQLPLQQRQFAILIYATDLHTQFSPSGNIFYNCVALLIYFASKR